MKNTYKQRVAEILVELEQGNKTHLEAYAEILDTVQEADEKIIEVKETVVHDSSVELNRRIFELEGMLSACRDNGTKLRNEINRLRTKNSPQIMKYKDIAEFCIDRGVVNGR